MAIIIKHIKVKCLQCKSPLTAKAKVDEKTGSVKKYLEIYGGDRKEFLHGYKANYCNKCLQDIDKKESKSPMKFSKGDRVKHLTKPEWGVGHVLFDSTEENVYIYFANVGEKKIKLKHKDIIYNNLIEVYEDEAFQDVVPSFS